VKTHELVDTFTFNRSVTNRRSKTVWQRVFHLVNDSTRLTAHCRCVAFVSYARWSSVPLGTKIHPAYHMSTHTGVCACAERRIDLQSITHATNKNERQDQSHICMCIVSNANRIETWEKIHSSYWTSYLVRWEKSCSNKSHRSCLIMKKNEQRTIIDIPPVFDKQCQLYKWDDEPMRIRLIDH
jgi:hypothetical protein